jgi:predicted nucleic acid-binding Zn ribbon protein
MGSVVRKHPKMEQTERMKVVAAMWNKHKGSSKKSSKRSKSGSRKKASAYGTGSTASNKKMSLSYLLKYF